MPGLKKYGTTEISVSSSDSANRLERYLRQFKNSPIHDKSYNHEQLIKIANKLMLDQDVDAAGNTINFNYENSPGWDDVRQEIEQYQGAGGYPTTPWTPNQASPGASDDGVNVDPSSIPQVDITPEQINEKFVEGVGYTQEPKTTSQEIASTKLGQSLKLGKRPS